MLGRTGSDGVALGDADGGGAGDLDGLDVALTEALGLGRGRNVAEADGAGAGALRRSRIAR